jgi:hypothetical protein
MPKTIIEAQFEKFDQDHPSVYREFKEIAVSLLNMGRKRYGAKAIIEYIRFNRNLKNRGELFTINNNFTAYYARKLAEEDNRFRDFFEFRRAGWENRNEAKDAA